MLESRGSSVRNLATLGGNLCNAAPSADMAPPLVALDAEAVIAGPKGERRVPIARFFTGVRKTALAPNEMLVELAVPSPGAHSGGQYLRHTPRRELDIAVVGVASQLTFENGRCVKARIALASDTANLLIYSLHRIAIFWIGATIVLAGNIEGETRTIPVAVYTLLNVRDGEAAVMRLVAVSVALALAALLGSFWLAARQRRREAG